MLYQPTVLSGHEAQIHGVGLTTTHPAISGVASDVVMVTERHSGVQTSASLTSGTPIKHVNVVVKSAVKFLTVWRLLEIFEKNASTTFGKKFERYTEG